MGWRTAMIHVGVALADREACSRRVPASSSPPAIEGTLTADVATLLTARLVVDGGCHRRQPDDRLRVLDHLERSWSVIAADDPDRWRSVTLTTALARVCKGLRGTAGINPRTRQRRFDWHVPAAPPGVGPVPCRWTTTTAP